MKQSKKILNRTVQRILKLARERNIHASTKKYRGPSYLLYFQRPRYFYAGKKYTKRRQRTHKFRKIRGGNSSSSSIPTEITVPFVDKSNSIQNTYSKLVSGTLQAQENGNV